MIPSTLQTPTSWDVVPGLFFLLNIPPYLSQVSSLGRGAEEDRVVSFLSKYYFWDFLYDLVGPLYFLPVPQFLVAQFFPLLS